MMISLTCQTPLTLFWKLLQSNNKLLNILQYGQCWGRYFLKVTRYILLFTLKMICVLQLATYYLETKVTIIYLHIT